MRRRDATRVRPLLGSAMLEGAPLVATPVSTTEAQGAEPARSSRQAGWLARCCVCVGAAWECAARGWQRSPCQPPCRFCWRRCWRKRSIAWHESAGPMKWAVFLWGCVAALGALEVWAASKMAAVEDQAQHSAEVAAVLESVSFSGTVSGLVSAAGGLGMTHCLLMHSAWGSFALLVACALALPLQAFRAYTFWLSMSQVRHLATSALQACHSSLAAAKVCDRWMLARFDEFVIVEEMLDWAAAASTLVATVSAPFSHSDEPTALQSPDAADRTWHRRSETAPRRHGLFKRLALSGAIGR